MAEKNVSPDQQAELIESAPAEKPKKKAKPKKAPPATPLRTAAELAEEQEGVYSVDLTAEETAGPLVAIGPATTVERLMERVVTDPNADVDKLERVIVIYEKERADQRRIDYHANFAKMQAELAPVARTKNVDDKFDYAPIEEIVGANGGIVNGHGFSYRFAEEDIPVQIIEADGEKKQLKKMRRYSVIISGYGHEESTSIDLPEYVDNPIANDAQKRGSSMSYGRRYALVAALGIVFKGADDDSMASFSLPESVMYAHIIADMSAAESGEEMIAVYREAYKGELAKDESGRIKITAVKEALKREWMAQQKAATEQEQD